MTNVEKLRKIRILGDVRQRLGSEDEHDASKDAIINEMDTSSLVAKWSGWRLGDEDWWVIMKSYYDKLNDLNDLNSKI